MPRIIYKLHVAGSQADFLTLEINVLHFFFFKQDTIILMTMRNPPFAE